MAQATLENIVEQVKTLSAEDLRQLNDVVQAQLAEQDEQARKVAAFHKALIDQGIVKEIKKRPSNRDHRRTLIEVRGKPVSETIIEERR